MPKIVIEHVALQGIRAIDLPVGHVGREVTEYGHPIYILRLHGDAAIMLPTGRNSHTFQIEKASEYSFRYEDMGPLVVG